jgi:hypothetical protein
MPRSRKTSTQPKKKTKQAKPKPRPVYPDFIQNFIDSVETQTSLKVRVDQYTGSTGYHVGVLKMEKNKGRCIWMVGFTTKPEELRMFWDSMAYKSWKEQSA